MEMIKMLASWTSPAILATMGFLLNIPNSEWLRAHIPGFMRWGEELSQLMEYGSGLLGFVCLILTTRILFIRVSKEKSEAIMADRKVNESKLQEQIKNMNDIKQDLRKAREEIKELKNA
jgi:hypothetical protein